MIEINFKNSELVQKINKHVMIAKMFVIKLNLNIIPSLTVEKEKNVPMSHK